MNVTALELNIESELETGNRFEDMQKQIELMDESMGKVRRSLFAQMTELKKLCLELKTENQEMKNILGKLSNEKTKWIYGQNDCLFDVQKHQEAVG